MRRCLLSMMSSCGPFVELRGSVPPSQRFVKGPFEPSRNQCLRLLARSWLRMSVRLHRLATDSAAQAMICGLSSEWPTLLNHEICSCSSRPATPTMKMRAMMVKTKASVRVIMMVSCEVVDQVKDCCLSFDGSHSTLLSEKVKSPNVKNCNEVDDWTSTRTPTHAYSTSQASCQPRGNPIRENT
nr:MAG TPA: hypothetical protein [Caudoviricetes sp.]